MYKIHVLGKVKYVNSKYEAYLYCTIYLINLNLCTFLKSIVAGCYEDCFYTIGEDNIKTQHKITVEIN